MSAKNNEYWDFCKAENSDDEENISDLQSRLYAEIYYTSDGQDNWSRNSTMKTELPRSDEGQKCEVIAHKACKTGPNISEPVDSNVCSNVGRVSKAFENNDKSNSTPLCDKDENAKSSAETDDKSKLIIPNAETLEQHSCKVAENDTTKDSRISHEMTNVKVTLHVHQQCNTNKTRLVQDETKLRNQEDMNRIDRVNPKVCSPKTNKSPSSCCKKSVGTNSDKNKEQTQSTQNNGANSGTDILTKYSFSKTFINTLYLKKYHSLKRKLEDGEEEEEEEEQNDVEGETDSRYNVLEKSQKQAQSQDVTVLSSDSGSDSEVSILEVPIPPKPNPPVINLKDSDEESSTSSDSDADEEHWNIPSEDSNIGSKELPHNEEDIVLNCTDVQKGASSIKEIRELSKNVEMEQCSPNGRNLSKKNKSNTATETRNRNTSESSEKTGRQTLEKDLLQDETTANTADSLFDPPLFSETIGESNATYERDKMNTSTNISSNASTSNLCNSEPSKSRKRQRENDYENNTSSSLKQKKCNDNGTLEIKAKKAQNHSKTKNSKEESWEEYIFRPMSDKLKAFYNAPRGQENFDVGEIQSKMSKDPRLWAILDEDLMSNLSKRNRFWNVRCNRCHQDGHQRYNCPEPRRPPQCHMCGVQGHVETRCPEKMCLTCGKKQGTFRKTCEFCKTLYCNMCKAVGHKSTECPDLWRRFHQTTGGSELNIPEDLTKVMKPADLLYCCNCTKRGHESSMCHEYRWSPHFPTPPFVSNYVGGLGCEEYLNSTLREGDIIPLVKRRKDKLNKCTNVMFLPEKDNGLINCHIIYSCGVFHTAQKDGQEILMDITTEKRYHLTEFLAGRVTPQFLEKLVTIVPFEVIVFRDALNNIMLRVRAHNGNSKFIYEIIVFWFQLQDDEKDRPMRVEFPRKNNQMHQFLISEDLKLQGNFPDLKHLLKLVNRCKKHLTIAQKPAERSIITVRLLDLQSKLLKLYHTKPYLSRAVCDLKRVIKRVRKHAWLDVPGPTYLRVVLYYNKIFMPYTIPEDEIDAYFLKYYSTEKKKCKANKKKKQGLTPYEKFIESLRSPDEDQIPAQLSGTSHQTYTGPRRSSRNIRKQTPDKLVTRGKDSDANNVRKINEIDPIVLQQFPCNHEISSTVSATECRTGTPSPQIISPNLTSIPLQEIRPVATPKQSNRDKSDIICIDLEKTRNVKEKQAEITNNNEKVAAEQDDSNYNASASKKKKKARKDKKKQDREDSASQSEERNASESTIINRAKRIINDALSFRLPYMSNAAADLQKRVSDKTITQEHIDVLRKLVDLEKDHQKHVTSFCSYLK